MDENESQTQNTGFFNFAESSSAKSLNLELSILREFLTFNF